ncbi:MAG: hypothetical protein AAFU73_15735 [Planctomycetota bacterium]
MISGLVLCRLGYQLIAAGLESSDGSLELRVGEHLSLRLSAVTPGVFLALFGSAIIGFSVWKGFERETRYMLHPTDEAVSSERLAAPAEISLQKMGDLEGA